jgi:hypothetical protein
MTAVASGRCPSTPAPVSSRRSSSAGARRAMAGPSGRSRWPPASRRWSSWAGVHRATAVLREPPPWTPVPLTSPWLTPRVSRRDARLVQSELEVQPLRPRAVQPVRGRGRKRLPPGFFPGWARQTNGIPRQRRRRPRGTLRPPPRRRTCETVNLSNAFACPPNATHGPPSLSRGPGPIGSTLDPLNSFPLSHLGTPSLAAFPPVLTPYGRRRRWRAPGRGRRAPDDVPFWHIASVHRGAHVRTRVPTFGRDCSKVAFEGDHRRARMNRARPGSKLISQ